MTTASHPVPVGRSREYEALAAAIVPDAPRLLVIAGHPGSGRSYMIEHLRAVAVALGIRCIGVDEELVVDRTTTSTDVLRVLHTLGGRADSPAPEPAVEERWWDRVVGLVDRIVDSTRVERAVLEELMASAPLLLAAEGYSPSPGFDSWLCTRVVPALREARAPVVLVITGLEANVANLSAIADVSVTLGDLDEAEVRSYLAGKAAYLDPPLSDDELTAYAVAATTQPAYVDSFSALFEMLGEDRRGTT